MDAAKRQRIAENFKAYTKQDLSGILQALCDCTEGSGKETFDLAVAELRSRKAS